jgi:hypothetical protein
LIAFDQSAIATAVGSEPVSFATLKLYIVGNGNDEIAIAEDPLHGTNNYEPYDGFVGIDVFVYTIYDDTDFDTTTVRVTVLDD